MRSVMEDIEEKRGRGFQAQVAFFGGAGEVTRTPFDRSSLVDQVANVIRDDILCGNLGPGERITVSSYAKGLGVSHIPVREALRRLEAESFVITVPNQGAIVAELRFSELHEVYSLRRLIEPDTIERAAAAYTVDDIGVIRETLQRLLKEDPADPDGVFWEAHHAFHWAILAPGFDVWRERVLGLLWQSAERYHRLFTLVFGTVENAQHDHRALGDAAERQDPDELRGLLLQHLTRTEQVVTAGYKAFLEQTADSEPAE